MTNDTDKELINQIKNLKAGIEERIRELEKREYKVNVSTNSTLVGRSGRFYIKVTKTIETTETI